jgi:hypothetical protein
MDETGDVVCLCIKHACVHAAICRVGGRGYVPGENLAASPARHASCEGQLRCFFEDHLGRKGAYAISQRNCGSEQRRVGVGFVL